MTERGLKVSGYAWRGALLLGVAVAIGAACFRNAGARPAIVHAAAGNGSGNASAIAGTVQASPAYTAEGKMLFPAKYREWIYLTIGMDMSYSPGMAGQSMFDNVFVNPEAYRSFVETGTWPDKTVMLIEARGAETRGSINKSGHFQGLGVMALEVHVKDDARTPGGWAFYEFNDQSSAEIVPATAACYSCHREHAAVATTFVQFYPTLLPIAKQKKTLSPAYLKEEAAKQP